MKIIIATGNANKVKEIRQILKGTDFEALSLKDIDINIDIEETGKTFEENAAIKAETIRNITGEMTIADDSGLVVDYLDGAPGIYSSRFMGEDTSYDIKNTAIIEKLKDAPEEKRTARFVCAMAIAFPDMHTECFTGVFEGTIAHSSAGEGGFGYDPIFYLPERGCTSAELSAEEKNKISHRGKALEMVVNRLKNI